jgi:hypothetical protein
VWGAPKQSEARYGVKIPPRPSKNRGQPRRPARSEQSQAKYSFPFRRIFWWRAQIRNRKEYFAWRRALASGGGAERIGFFQEFLIK